jgi:aspartate ammonia-lyase
MNNLLARIRDASQRAWITFISNMNKLMLAACAGVVMLNQINPQFVNTLTNSMTKTQQAIAAFAFCTIVQFAIKQVKKAGE